MTAFTDFARHVVVGGDEAEMNSLQRAVQKAVVVGTKNNTEDVLHVLTDVIPALKQVLSLPTTTTTTTTDDDGDQTERILSTRTKTATGEVIHPQ